MHTTSAADVLRNNAATKVACSGRRYGKNSFVIFLRRAGNGAQHHYVNGLVPVGSISTNVTPAHDTGEWDVVESNPGNDARAGTRCEGRQALTPLKMSFSVPEFGPVTPAVPRADRAPRKRVDKQRGRNAG